MNKLGFWSDFHFRGDILPSLFENGSLTKRSKVIDSRVIDYLKSGIWLYKARTLFSCIITEEFVGTPHIYTDGKWFWTSEYIYYLENYNLELPIDFFEWMENNNYQVPKIEDFDDKEIESLQEEIRHYGY